MTQGLRTTSDIHQALLRRREWMKGRKQKFLLKPPRILHPVAIERAYEKQLKSLVRRLSDVVDRILFARLESLIERGQREQGIKMDAFDDEFQAVIDGITLEFGRELTESELRSIAISRGLELSRFNRIQNDKVFKSVLNVDVFRNEPWLEPQIRAFATQNAQLIKSIENDILKDISVQITQSVREGRTIQETAKSIRERFGVAEKRAAFIARDQISKLNGQLTQVRQTDLGVRRYRWRDSSDIRVRDSHRAKDGKIYRWDRPPPDTGHPGYDYNCRCWAEPILEDLV